MASLLACLALTVGTAACRSAAPSAPDAGPEPGTDAGVLPGVTGQRALLYLTSAGEERVPVDVSATPPRALVLEGGAFVTYEGVGRADGTFVIPHVPAGPYYLSIEPTVFVVTDAREVELSSGTYGRPGAATLPAGAGGATVIFELGNLHPYESTDGITLFSANVNVARYRLTPSAASKATSGAFTYSVRAGQPLIDPGLGDRVLLTQLSSRTAPLEGSGEAVAYRSVSRAFEAPAFQTRPGETQKLSGTMTEPPALTTSLHWELAAYRNLATAVNPRATVAGQLLVFDVLPTPRSYGYLSLVPRLVELLEPPAVDALRTTLTYANPYPASWSPIGLTESRYQVAYQLPGTKSPATLSGVLSSTDTLPEFLSKPIAPAFGPVRQPRIEGMDAWQPVTLTTPTPELSWTAPDVPPGTRCNYTVFIHQLSAQGSATVSRFVGSVRTTDTRVRLPPGLLSPGGTYVFVFDANTTPGRDILQQAVRIPIPLTGSQALSEVITVR
ncbi:hypothetical protein NR798_05545 [Archangium gephyra]|uniref:hypothetical protein n=1 Tax=Archangium gephyra TaxID=48 RepID=UPI0035D479F9